MTRFLIAGATFAALCASAHAATLTFTPYTGIGSFDAPGATTSSNFASGVTGSTGSMTSPFGDSTTPYDVAYASGSATFDSSGSGTFSLLWGSPDSYNTLSFMSGADTVASFTGSDVAGGSRSGSYLVTISGLSSYDSFAVSSGSDAFEFAVSAVPLPTTLPLFGGAVLLLAAFGMGLRGRATNRA